jgi:threonine/homoserine/homoserine lactone efflux protein
MPDASHFSLFLTAALLLALTPGPGIFYVLARTLAGGRKEGTLSSLGTFVGGLVHVFAAAFGLSAILAASAMAFGVVKCRRRVSDLSRHPPDPGSGRP